MSGINPYAYMQRVSQRLPEPVESLIEQLQQKLARSALPGKTVNRRGADLAAGKALIPIA